jgi:L-ascorbate metabolism protein UlaG (beta-lactamase superfamily)
MQKVMNLTSDVHVEPDFQKGSVFFVGTATTVLNYAGFTILTDPNFLHAGDHVHLGYGMTSERLTNPAIDIEQLPNVDFCVLSHLHGDHFDQLVEEKLDKNLPIITTSHGSEGLKEKGFNRSIALDTWQSIEINKNDAQCLITAMPGKHAPSGINFFLPPVMGSLLEFKTSDGNKLISIYITGDTLVFDELKEIPRRCGNPDLMLLHLGGTMIMGVMLTMDGDMGVEAINIIKPDKVIPIHYNDYDVFKSPLSDFKQAVERAGLNDKVHYLSHGETYGFEVPNARFSKTVRR